MWPRTRRRIRSRHASSFGVLCKTWGAGRVSEGRATNGGGAFLPWPRPGYVVRMAVGWGSSGLGEARVVGDGEVWWVGMGGGLTWPRGRQRREAARCAGRCSCSVAHGRRRERLGWRSTRSCPSTGAAPQL